MNSGAEALLPKIAYAVIGAAGALLPYAFREGAFGVRPEMTPEEKQAAKFRAGLCVLGGFLASLTMTDVVSLWLDPYLPGNADQIEHGVALFLGLGFMQAIEVAVNWWRSRGAKVLDKVTGIDK